MNFGSFAKGGIKTFNFTGQAWDIVFDTIKYEVSLGKGDEFKAPLYAKLLHDPLTEQEINNLVHILGESILDHIEENTKKLGLR